MTTDQREQWAQDAERSINIRAMMYTGCGQMEGIAHDHWLWWWLQKAGELVLSGQRDVNGDERSDVLERLQHNLATTPPDQRWPCWKGLVLLKLKQDIGSFDAKPGLIRKESELKKGEEGERVL